MASSVQTEMLGQDVQFTISEEWLAYWLVILRMVAGWWLLHSGLDKLLNWPFDASWFVGGAAKGTSIGPFVTLFDSGILLSFTNIMVPVGQTLIGLGLILGALTKLAAFFGAFLMVFFYFINGEGGGWDHGLVTAELFGIVVFAMIATLGAGRVLGVDSYIAKTGALDRNPVLRYFIG